MFSGGVGEYVYGREERDFGDMGRRLGQALRKRLDAGALPWPLLPAGECIRATALGASEYSVQLSGNTSTITDPGRAAAAPQSAGAAAALSSARRPSIPDSARGRDPRAFHRLRPERRREPRWRWRCAGAARRRTSASSPSRRASCAAWRNTVAQQKPLYIMLDGDVAQTLGAILREELDVQSEILAIDGVVLWDFDYIDLGRIRLPSMTVPVTIKSLVFSEDPRLPRGQAHLHDHGHGHSPPWRTVTVIITTITSIAADRQHGGRTRSLMTTPSFSGSTRGESSGVMRTRANSMRLGGAEHRGERAQSGLILHSSTRSKPQARATSHRSTPPCVWLACMPVSP